MKNEQTKEYYNLKELQEICGLKYRQLVNRVKEVQNKYHENDSRIFKKSNQWVIHKSLIKQFNRKRKPNVKYNFMITISPSPNNHYDHDGWRFIVLQLHKKFKVINPESVTRYSIEKTENFMNHVHILTTLNNKTILNKILDKDYYTKNGNIMSIDIEPVWDQKGAVDYIQKFVKSKILR